MFNIRPLAVTLCAALSLTLAAPTFGDDTATPALKEAEAQYYRIVTLPIPEGVALEAGALQWLGHGRLAASTRRGDIYFIDNALEDPPKHLKFTQFAGGLHEVL